MSLLHPHILQISGATLVGGIRKHICDLALNSIGSNSQSIAYCSNNHDSVFAENFPQIQESLVSSVGLVIPRRPAFQDASNILTLVRFVKEHNVDVLHGHGAKGGIYARVVGLITRKKVVYTPHGGVLHAMFSPFESFLYKWIERLLAPFTDVLLFESEYSRDRYQSFVTARHSGCIVNYNGVMKPNIEKLRIASNELELKNRASFNLAIFGLLRPEKGQHYAITALQDLVKRGLDVSLHVFGDGPDRHKLEDLSSELGVKDKVSFYGNVSNPLEWMLKIDLVLVPSEFESFGYVAVEAKSVGKRVIASDVGGLKEVLAEDPGSRFPMGDTSAIANLVEAIIADNSHLQCAPEVRFRLEDMIDKTMAIYSSFLVTKQ
jgi:glycosyltransferase involved in cell wall biosynthesis